MIVTGKYKASNFFMRRGIILDLEKGCYRIINKLFSFIPIKEKCVSVPNANYILLFRTLYAKCEACELEDFEKGKNSVVQLSIVFNKNRRLIIDEGNNLRELTNKAHLLAKHFNLKIRDAATNRKSARWLLPESSS